MHIHLLSCVLTRDAGLESGQTRIPAVRECLIVGLVMIKIILIVKFLKIND